MKLQTYNNSHLIVVDEQNEVIGLLNAANEVEPSLLVCLASEYDCKVEITNMKNQDSMGIAYFTISCLEEGSDLPYDRSISVKPVWLFEEKAENIDNAIQDEFIHPELSSDLEQDTFNPNEGVYLVDLEQTSSHPNNYELSVYSDENGEHFTYQYDNIQDAEKDKELFEIKFTVQ